MRGVLLAAAFVLSLAALAEPSQPRTTTPVVSAPDAVFALQIPEKKIDITIGDRGGYAAWYRNPAWIAIGGLAVLLLLLIMVLALRGTGGGTTIIRE
jgi:hypothetical protein